MANDPEFADMIAESEDPTKKWSPRISQMDLHATVLIEILEAIKGNQSAIIAAAGGTPKPNKPFPRPVTEVDSARDRLEKRAASAMLEMAGFDPSEYL